MAKNIIKKTKNTSKTKTLKIKPAAKNITKPKSAGKSTSTQLSEKVKIPEKEIIRKPVAFKRTLSAEGWKRSMLKLKKK